MQGIEHLVVIFSGPGWLLAPSRSKIRLAQHATVPPTEIKYHLMSTFYRHDSSAPVFICAGLARPALGVYD